MSSEEPLNIPDGGGSYLSGEFVKTKGITSVKIVEPVPRMQKFEDGDKVQVSIAYVGQTNGDPSTWTMNMTSARALKSAWTEMGSKWVNKVVPIEVSKTAKGYAIYVDTTKLAQQEQTTQGVLS